ncbi:hypothetical protein BELL_0794g00030 [Botrytis elliptica]|uniref:Histone deacetylase domain-containing protein n=1 Tax=Botrytis elliptica TaxID=278938 RepID=A0A4Z1JC84_9HELO|nr:hypothetical protein EAE99_011159 [Botrytis elliptica]TGO69062.1 hypothetical protein BELL_0794g00030 [Botrytis elliptica]
MAYSSPNGGRNASPSPVQLPSSTSNNDTPISNSLRRLSISNASRTGLPISPQTFSTRATSYGGHSNLYPSPSGRSPVLPSPLRRSSSTASFDQRRSSTSHLSRKPSLNSLNGGGLTPNKNSINRRSSTQFAHRSPSVMGTKSLLSQREEEMREPSPRHTAASIASSHFKSELDLQDKNDGSRSAETIVILHDSVYGHRFSRPKTSRTGLSTIVERPERIHASILGLSVAYVRLGERHSEGRYPLHPGMEASAVPSTPFRIRKTTRRMSLSSQAITNVHGVKWMEELKIMCDNAEAKLAMSGKELARPEMNRGPNEAPPSKFHEGDLYLCAESLDAMEGALGAVCEGVDAVFEGSSTGFGPRRSFIAIRPPGHHCSASYPSGFCWLNNVHVGISHASLTHGLTHAAIIDFDLHHGDGSQAIAWEHNARANGLAKNALPWKKTSIGYFSLHDINSYPCEMGDEEKVKNASLCIENAHGQNIWNVHLQPWKTEEGFWELYESKYSVLLEKTRNFLRTQYERLQSSPNGPKPKAAIFLSAGFDASEWESSGMQRHKVNVPTEFYARLTRDVVKLAAEEGTGVDGRIISVLEGGYSDRALCTGVLSHLSGLSGSDPVAHTEKSFTGLNFEMGQRLGVDPLSPGPPSPYGFMPYDPLWWSQGRLEQLDAAMNSAPVAEEPKTQKAAGPQGNFASPTQSFIAKVVNTPTAQRSVSTMGMRNGVPVPRSSPPRPPTPPPPDVHWTVAAHELSKLLIPTDRQTKSCQWEDLAAEATKARKERQSLANPEAAQQPANPEPANARMSLRTRKPPPKLLDSIEKDEVKKAAAKSNRRRTVPSTAASPVHKAPPAPSASQASETNSSQSTQKSARRLSAASISTTGTMPPPSRPVPAANRAPSLPQRPSSSMSVRPGSATSSRGPPPPPVVVKKTRAPAKPRTDASKPGPGRPRKKSPPGTGSDSNTKNTIGAVPTAENSNQSSDVDSLTSGMKKIKISLLTKAQKEAKEEEKHRVKIESSQEDGQAYSNMSNETPPTTANSETTYNQSATSTPIMSISPGPSTPQLFLPPRDSAQLEEPEQVPLPTSSPIGPPMEQYESGNVSDHSSNYSADRFVPFQPQGPIPSTIAQQEPLRWLPPNTNTPAAVKKYDLPVFTSTSAIPFASNSDVDNQNEPSNSHVEQDSSPSESTQLASPIWDIPVTQRDQ